MIIDTTKRPHMLIAHLDSRDAVAYSAMHVAYDSDSGEFCFRAMCSDGARAALWTSPDTARKMRDALTIYLEAIDKLSLIEARN